MPDRCAEQCCTSHPRGLNRRPPPQWFPVLDSRCKSSRVRALKIAHEIKARRFTLAGFSVTLRGRQLASPQTTRLGRSALALRQLLQYLLELLLRAGRAARWGLSAL